MGQKEDILHLALIFHGLEMPMHGNHKTSSQRKCERHKRGRQKR